MPFLLCFQLSVSVQSIALKDSRSQTACYVSRRT